MWSRMKPYEQFWAKKKRYSLTTKAYKGLDMRLLSLRYKVWVKVNIPHKSLTFFAINLMSFSTFLMEDEYGPRPWGNQKNTP